MRVLSLPAVVVALFVLVSGCVGGDGSGSKSAGVATMSDEPTADDMGSVVGRVTDEEQVPVAGATVSLGDASTVTTDADGRFALQDVQPGTHSLFVQRLGYEAVARKVEVVAGAVAEVTIVLVALAVTDEPYHLSLNKVALIHLDNIYLSDCLAHCGAYVNHSLVNGLRCDPCQFVLHMPVAPVGAMTEAVWAPSGNDLVNLDMCYYYYRDWSEEDSGEFVTHWCLTNRMSYGWPEAELKNMKTASALKFHVHGGVEGVNYEHRIDTWTTFAYEGELPEGFSALPPT